MGSSPISGTREPQVIFSSFCAPRFARRRARDREPQTSARPRSSVASSSPPPRAACISGTPAVFACTVLPMCLLRPHSPLLGAGRLEPHVRLSPPSAALSSESERPRRVSLALPTFLPQKATCHPRECTVHASAHLYQRGLWAHFNKILKGE